MSGRQYYQKRSYSKNTYAERHIEQAKLLTLELGGTDEDVKQWFFNLPLASIDKILSAYQQAYGEKPGRYARETFADWKSGRRRMSGLVAERLFKLLPPFMPIEDKYGLVESLWNHVSPTTKRLVKAGPGSAHTEVIETVIREVRSLSTNWEIPEQMQKRFKWLAADDSATYKKLLAHIKEKDRALGESILKEQIPILKNKFDNDLKETTSRLSYIIEVGKQSVELRLIPDIETISVGDWHPEYRTRKTGSVVGIPWWIWLIGAAILFTYVGER